MRELRVGQALDSRVDGGALRGFAQGGVAGPCAGGRRSVLPPSRRPLAMPKLSAVFVRPKETSPQSPIPSKSAASRTRLGRLAPATIA